MVILDQRQRQTLRVMLFLRGDEGFKLLHLLRLRTPKIRVERIDDEAGHGSGPGPGKVVLQILQRGISVDVAETVADGVQCTEGEVLERIRLRCGRDKGCDAVGDFRRSRPVGQQIDADGFLRVSRVERQKLVASPQHLAGSLGLVAQITVPLRINDEHRLAAQNRLRNQEVKAAGLA